MPEGILITCAACGKQMKVPEHVAGKKIRCTGCRGVVPVPTGGGKAVDTRVTTAQIQKKIAAAKAEEEIARDPYGVIDESLKARCPFCAYELESDDARICLHCGYDMVKRGRVASKQVYERTTADFVMWHLPTAACILGVLAMIGGLLYYHYWLPDIVLGADDAKKLGDDRWGYFDIDDAPFSARMFHWGIEVWLIVIFIFVSYKLLRFAFSRLFFHFLPEEKIKHTKSES
jgi:hypothetical protein